MEYNVFDLIKQLLKKWYIILLVMIVVCGAAVGLSQYSYQKAVEDYYAHTTQTKPQLPDVGQMVALVHFSPTEASLGNLQELVGQLDDEKGSVSDEKLNQAIMQLMEPQVIEKIMDSDVLTKVHERMVENGWDPNVLLSDHFCVQDRQNQTIQLVASGLTESQSRAVFEMYLTVLSETFSGPMLDIEFVQQSCTFTLLKPEYTEDAKFAQTVMQAPVEKPNMVKTALTGAIFGFAIGAIAVLFWIFVKDASKKERDEKSK